MTGGDSIALELLEGADGLDRLGEEWEALEGSSANHIFQTYAYAQLWMRTVGASSGATPVLVVGREDNRVVGIFPACRVRENTMPLLAWLGGPSALDYGDVLFDTAGAHASVDEFVGEALALLSRYSHGAMLYLTNVRDDATAIEPLRARMRVVKRSSAPYVPIEDTYDDYLASRGRSLRYNLNRKWRRLESAGDVDAEMLEPGDPEVVPTMARLVEFVRARHHTAGDRTNLFDEAYVRLRTELAASHPAGRLSRIRVAGVTIAACLHAVHHDRLYCLVHGYDAEYATYSPGQLLHGFIVRTCFERAWDPCDLCWGDEPYKHEWTDLEEPLTSFVSDDARGAIYSTAMATGRRFAGATGSRRKKSR